MRLFTVLLLMIILLIQLLQPVVLRAQASPDTVRPGNGRLLTGVLKPGLRQYLVCFQNPASARMLMFWYWLRDISVEERNGVKTFAITQHWYGSDTAWYRSVYSLNTVKDFAPVYHREFAGGKLSAYDWNGDGILGADSVDGNMRKGFKLDFDQPNYNWNLDIETFEMLPLAAGRSFLINFYDAGLEPPRYVLYRVTGSEDLLLMDGKRTDCWKLFTEGSSPGSGAYSETYWISKKEHEFLKEEDHFNGMIRYKVKMPGTAPDLLANFTK